MRIWSGTILDPKNGAAIKKAPTLNDAIKMRIKNNVKSWRFNPGSWPSSLIIGNKL